MIEWQHRNNVCHIKGCLKQQDVTLLWSKRHELLNQGTETLELSELNYSDSAGLAFILELWRLSHARGRTLKLVSVSAQLNKLIALYDLQACFNKQ